MQPRSFSHLFISLFVVVFLLLLLFVKPWNHIDCLFCLLGQKFLFEHIRRWYNRHFRVLNRTSGRGSMQISSVSTYQVSSERLESESTRQKQKIQSEKILTQPEGEYTSVYIGILLLYQDSSSYLDSPLHFTTVDIYLKVPKNQNNNDPHRNPAEHPQFSSFQAFKNNLPGSYA